MRRSAPKRHSPSGPLNDSVVVSATRGARPGGVEASEKPTPVASTETPNRLPPSDAEAIHAPGRTTNCHVVVRTRGSGLGRATVTSVLGGRGGFALGTAAQPQTIAKTAKLLSRKSFRRHPMLGRDRSPTCRFSKMGLTGRQSATTRVAFPTLEQSTLMEDATTRTG